MKKFNWQEIEKLVKGFYPDGITPILAFGSEFPIELKEGVGNLIDLSYFGGEKYTFYTSLIRKDNEYVITVRAYSVQPFGEYPVVVENKSFTMTEKDSAHDYLKLPLKYFNMEGHIRIVTFKNSRMEEEEFKEIIELWRTQPSQIKN